MAEKIFFQSSMPRAGSTLLQNILNQHPDIYATATDGAVGLIQGARNAITLQPEFLAQPPKNNEKAIREFLRAGLKGYYESFTDKKYIVTKSRGYLSAWDILNELDDVKMICMVRDMRDVIASLEKRFRNTPYNQKNWVNYNEMKYTTFEKRVEFYVTNAPLVYTIDTLRDAIQMPYADDILFVKYEQLLSHPKEVMKAIYKYLGIKQCKHNFNKIEQTTHENDAVHGIFGDHNIRPKLAPPSDDAFDILGQDLCDRIYNSYPWFFEYFEYER